MKKPVQVYPDRVEAPHVSDATLREFAGYHMKRAFNVIQADVNRTLKPFELRMVTFSTLTLIVDNPGLRQAQLADALAVERPNLVVIIDELERRDLIVRNRVPTDRRAYALNATLTGHRLHGQALAAVRGHEARMFRDLDQATKDVLISVMEGIRQYPEGSET
ncbi:MarR family winged helix-turn-helix transcriptional regulator [Falsiphaeobacter marinintestinus]|uniref:MarR family winged helix-turn-helix transcriptional regulator n=1 Tax=Falsiphaeobacter marinintestinus TaxID=1492905 RepID=UPI0011B446DC|nr:MarR family transcriptional regulator [Phaeobacter marinintestinus]